MSNYKDIVGTAVRNNAGNLPAPETGQIWFDSTNLDFKYLFPATVASWRSAPSINTARSGLGTSAGTQDSALIAGGEPFTGDTEEYNGTSWTELNDLSTASQQGGGAGSSVSGIHMGGYPGVSATEEWTAGLTNKTITAS